MNQTALEEQRLTMLQRLNDIDAKLAGLNKSAIAQAVAAGTRGLDRRDVKSKSNQIRNGMLATRQDLVRQKTDLTTEYCRVKLLLKQQPQREGLVVTLLKAILASLGGAMPVAADKPGQPKARPME